MEEGNFDAENDASSESLSINKFQLPAIGAQLKESSALINCPRDETSVYASKHGTSAYISEGENIDKSKESFEFGSQSKR